MRLSTRFTVILLVPFVAALLSSLQVVAQDESPKPAAQDAAEVAKKLANPIASLVSVPFQNNLDIGIGPHHGSKNTLNFQPVIR
jgi:hypothetical protein